MPTNTNRIASRERGGIANNHSSNYTKKFPPYGKRLDQLRRKGLIPSLRVIVSTSWDLGAAYPRIVIPDDIPIVNLNFSYLAGLSVQIVHCNGETSINDLIDEILKIKPKILTVFNYDQAKQRGGAYPAVTLIYPESVEALLHDH